MGSTARFAGVHARVTPHRGLGESLVPLYTRESGSLYEQTVRTCHGHGADEVPLRDDAVDDGRAP
jgi:hypothetical protein